jgi:hypothetical protein
MVATDSKLGSQGARRSPGSQADYAVGYGKPPVATRFKPGQSGNPKGRLKHHRNLRTVLEETLNERIAVREGERSRRLTKREALILTIVNNALKCDPKALASLMTLMRTLGMADEAPGPSQNEPITQNDAALLADFLARHAAAKSPVLNKRPANGGRRPARKER